MLGKRGYNTMGKKSYYVHTGCADLAPTDLEAMGDSSALREATSEKEAKGQKLLQDEAAVYLAKQKAIDDLLAEKAKQQKIIEDNKKRSAEEEEKKRQPIAMDLDNMPSDYILPPPKIENSEPEKPKIIGQLSMPLVSKQKVYYTQIMTKNTQ